MDLFGKCSNEWFHLLNLWIIDFKYLLQLDIYTLEVNTIHQHINCILYFKYGEKMKYIHENGSESQIVLFCYLFIQSSLLEHWAKASISFLEIR
jgi:hypothetical protein